MSPKELPAPGRAGGIMDVMRARHSSAEKTGEKQSAPAGPFLPRPVDPAAVTGSAEERLAVFEAAIDRARSTAGETLKAARARFVVEAGTALRAIRDEDGGLYKVTHATFEEYIDARWEMDRSRAYQLIDAAPTVLAMWKIFDTAPVESHTPIVAPVLEAHGEVAVKEVVASITTAGEKVTAASLREAIKRLGYLPAQADPVDDAPPPTEHSRTEARALVRLEQGLAALKVAHRALRGRVIPNAVAADQAHGSELVAEVADLAEKICRLAQ